ncbi:acetyl-coenzyme A synthetase, cytoplasmic-like [Ptychodera flava]|uniref:acetyl-coenzyme A synthetase, cytoplasmic-like n=1 Tax=Ptychodera flava TaxID=63121 RepID=UPI00396A932C
MATHEEALKAVYKPSAEFQKNAHVSSMEKYREMHKQSVEDPDTFWGNIAKDFYWKTAPEGKVLDYNFNVSKGKIEIKWFEGAVTNICYNVLDRNVKDRGLGDRIAFYWEGNDPDDSAKYTYGELLKLVCKFANVLKSQGVKKGDRVAIYMPMIIELVVAMLACARIGAVHSIVFAGFSSESLAGRILDAKCEMLITTDGVYRGTKLINLKEISDGAMAKCKENAFSVKKCIVVRHLGDPVNGTDDKTSSPAAKRPCKNLRTPWNPDKDMWWHELMTDVSEECEPEWMGAEEPLFMLYTSGSTGKPKGVLHTTGGYMLYTATTFKYTFDYHPDDIYHCTADIGWITGHSYVVYGPMANAATSVMFEGVPTYPDAGRFWEYVDKYKINQFYTAPTAIRSLMKFGDSFVTKHSRASLKVLGTVGEPINPEAWVWYHKVVGDGRCPVVDTFWQTETGGHVVTPLPGCTPAKPGAACFPFFGVVPAIIDESTGKEIDGPGEGYLVFKQPWPGIMRTVYGDHERFERTYFSKFPGYYVTGDGCRRDADGYYWITGRIDDMLNVSGHLLSTAEIESSLVEHPSIAEAAVVSHPHKVKGESTYCFVTLKDGTAFNDDLVSELKDQVRKTIGPFAKPDYIQNAPALPKTRSGKIMRRVLRKIACNDRDFGDISTLADPSVVELLLENRPNIGDV